MKSVKIKGSIRLDQFLKWTGIASTGGQGKILIQSGFISVNGEIVESRGKKLQVGDTVSIKEIGDFIITEDTKCDGLG